MDSLADVQLMESFTLGGDTGVLFLHADGRLLSVEEAQYIMALVRACQPKPRMIDAPPVMEV